MDDKLLTRPTTIKCSVCETAVPVGARGPIPTACAEHRGRPKGETLAPRVKLPREEVDRIRQGYKDAIELERAAKEALEEEKRRHWRTQELVRDLRLDRAELLARVRERDETIRALEALIIEWWADPDNPPSGAAAIALRDDPPADDEGVSESPVEREADA